MSAPAGLVRSDNMDRIRIHDRSARGSRLEERWYLNEIDLVRQLPESERELLDRNSTVRKYPRGTIIHAPGDKGADVSFVIGGRVKIYNLSACGKEIIYRFCGPNSFFGVAEIFGGGEREVFAEAVEDSEVMSTDRQYFVDLILRNPALALTVMRILSSRIRQAHQAIQGFVFCDVRARLAQLLVKLAQINGVKSMDGSITLRNRFTHQELANMIGANRQAVTERLNHFKHDGYIRVVGEHIMLTDPAGLRALVSD